MLQKNMWLVIANLRQCISVYDMMSILEHRVSAPALLIYFIFILFYFGQNFVFEI